MIEPLRLTDLNEATPGPGRVARRFPTLGGTFTVLRELISAAPRDFLRGLRPSRITLLRIEDGICPNRDGTQIALYVHYSVINQISDMVLCQIDSLRRSGFSVVFISMSKNLSDGDWQAVRTRCTLVVQRDNFGYDFGAWRDLLPEIRRRWSIPDELMLVNDSVLGPIHPLAPVIDTMRKGGQGLFGLTESLQGGPHLQSYMLLARGRSTVEDLMRFFQKLHVTHSKLLLIRRGEIKLSRWMRRRGHRVAAVFGYDRLVQAALADPQERKRLFASVNGLEDPEKLSNREAAALLHESPVNPTHELWRVLATRFNGPFLKTELVVRNPMCLSDVADWPTVVSPDAPCSVPIIQAHIQAISMASN
jgi:hypothetical protein